MGPAIIVTDLALKFTHIYHTSKRWNTNYILNIPHSVCNQKVIKKNKKAFKKKLQILQKLSQKWKLHTKKIHLQITLMLVAHFMNLVWKDAILPKHHSVQLYNYANTNKMKKPQKQNLVVGKLMHLAIYTCLNIAFAISKLSQFNSNPSTLSRKTCIMLSSRNYRSWHLVLIFKSHQTTCLFGCLLCYRSRWRKINLQVCIHASRWVHFIQFPQTNYRRSFVNRSRIYGFNWLGQRSNFSSLFTLPSTLTF